MKKIKIVKQETKQQKDNRAKLCYSEIEAILKKYNCEIQPVGTISNKGVELGLNINSL